MWPINRDILSFFARPLLFMVDFPTPSTPFCNALNLCCEILVNLGWVLVSTSLARSWTHRIHDGPGFAIECACRIFRPSHMTQNGVEFQFYLDLWFIATVGTPFFPTDHCHGTMVKTIQSGVIIAMAGWLGNPYRKYRALLFMEHPVMINGRSSSHYSCLITLW